MRFRDLIDAELGAGLDMTGEDVGAERIDKSVRTEFLEVISVSLADEANGPA